ncbi:MAG: DMT family transporter [Sphingomonadales bacterium]|jgi:drug/metabolite transporter (DMT)-like permease
MSKRGWLAFALLTCIWGSTWLVIKTQLGVVPPGWAVAWRFCLAALVMLGLCLVRGQSLRLPPGGHGFALLLALSQFILNFNLVYRANAYLTSGLVAVCFALLIVPNTLGAALLFGQRVSLRFIGGAALGIAGVGLLFAHDFAAPGADPARIATGLALAIAGVLAASVGNVMQASPRGRAMPLDAGLAWGLTYGAIGNVTLAVLLAGPPVFDWRPGFIAGLLYLGVMASAVAFSLYYLLIRELGPGRAAYNGVVVPVVAMLLSTVFEGYHWTLVSLAGAGLALAGLVVALRAR